MSLYMGNDTNGKALIHLTSEVTAQAVLATGNSVESTLFNSNNAFLYIKSVETVYPVVVRNDVYVYTLEWRGTDVGTDFLYIVNEFPLNSILVGDKTVDSGTALEKTFYGIPSAEVLPVINGKIAFRDLLYNSNVEDPLYRAPKQFLVNGSGYLQFKSGADDLGSGSFPTYGVKSVPMTRINYGYFKHTDGPINIGPNTFSVGSLDMKNIQMFSATTSPNAYDRYIPFGGGLYLQFLNEYSVTNYFGGLSISNTGIFSHVNGGFYDLITANTITHTNTKTLVPFSITLVDSYTNSTTRRYIITLTESYQAALIKVRYTHVGLINTYYATAWVPNSNIGQHWFIPSLPTTEAAISPGGGIYASGSNSITILVPDSYDYHTNVVILSIDILN